MLIGSTKHTDCFAIKLHLSLCIYMHRSTLAYIYIYPISHPQGDKRLGGGKGFHESIHKAFTKYTH